MKTMYVVGKVKSRTKRTIRKIINFFKYEKIVDLKHSQWWSYDKLREFQNRRLEKIVAYAYENIPAYRKKFERARVTPEDIRSIEDLSKLPITTREEMQDNQDFVNKDLVTGELYTGGSTGATLRYFESFESGKIRSGVHLRGWRWNGYEHGKQKLAVVSSAQGVVEGENTLNLLGDLSELNIKKNLGKILEFRPQYLRGYVSSLYILANYCIDHNIKIDFVESINTISENLYDFQRESIEQAFGGKVFEEYCCNDGGACAWECEAHEGLHYAMERAVIEEVNGEVIVTDLWNRAMPFIRYRNGDSVTFLKKECSCGRKLPLIKVKGRTNDILIGPKGPISPTYVMHNWYDGSKYEENREFRTGISLMQFIQKPNYMLIINIVKNPNWTQNMFREFEAAMRKTFVGMQMSINIVDFLEATAKGKRYFIINEDRELLKQWGYLSQ